MRNSTPCDNDAINYTEIPARSEPIRLWGEGRDARVEGGSAKGGFYRKGRESREVHAQDNFRPVGDASPCHSAYDAGRANGPGEPPRAVRTGAGRLRPVAQEIPAEDCLATLKRFN